MEPITVFGLIVVLFAAVCYAEQVIADIRKYIKREDSILFQARAFSASVKTHARKWFRSHTGKLCISPTKNRLVKDQS